MHGPRREPMTKPRNPKPQMAPKAPKAAQARGGFRAANSRTPSAPGAVVNRRAADRLRAGHLWVYASDVEAITLQNQKKRSLPVADNRGIFLGTALYSPSSQIALRLVSREALDEAGWLKLLESRLRAAIARRKPLLDAANDACRLCFSEADELPGLVADKYGELVVLQLLTKGLLAAGVRRHACACCARSSTPAAIFERPDPRIRELEGLPAPSPDPLVACRSRAADRQHAVPSQRPRLSLRRQRRPKDRRVSRPARQLRSRAGVGAAARGGEIRLAKSGGPRARCLLLPGRFCPAPRPGLPPGDGHRRLARLARSGRAQSRSQSLRASPPKSTGSRPTRSRFCATGRKRARASTPSFSIRPPSPKPNAPSKAPCAATRN